MASDSCLPSKRPGRGHGAFRASTPAVYIPAAHRFLESYIRSIARDRRGKSVRFFMSMMTYIEAYVDGDGFLEESNL